MNRITTIALIALLLLPAVIQAQYVTDVVPDLGERVMYYTANSAGNGTTTLCFPELIQTGALGSAPSYIGYSLTCIYDAGGAGALPQRETRAVTGFAPTTGVLTFVEAFTLAASEDKFWLHLDVPSLTTDSFIGVASIGTGASVVDGIDSIYVLSLIGQGSRFNGGPWRLRVLYDAGGAHAAPETQYRDIVSASGTTGLVVVAAFSNAIGAADILLIYDGTEEGLIETNDASLDSLTGALYGDVGLQWGTSAVPANGVAIDEVLRKIYDLTAATAGTPNDWDTLVVYVDHVLVDSIWVTVGENEVITMPNGASVECYLTVRDSIALDGADSVSVCMGDGTSTLLTKFAKVDWDAGEYITFAPASVGTYRVENPSIVGWTPVGDGMAGTGMFHFVSNGADIGYNVQTATIITTGYSIWTLVYRVRSGSGSPSAGAGGDL